MSQSIGIKSSPTGPFVYVENVVGNSLAFGSDNTAQMFVLNTSVNPNVVPNSTTANINFDPTANGDITFIPNGSGDSVFDTGNIIISAGSLDLPLTNSALTEGIISVNGVQYFNAYGVQNLFFGPMCGNGTLNTVSAQQNFAFGYLSLSSLTTGSGNSIFGWSAGKFITTGIRNDCFAFDAGKALTTGSQNICFGYQSGLFITTGSDNTYIGYQAGYNNTGADSNNIYIRNVGALAENNAIRIGTQGSGAGQQNKTFIAGIASVAVSNKNYVTIDTTTGQMGSDNAPLSSISITGDTGGALTGSAFTFAGGTTGLSFGGSGSTQTLTFAGITANGGTISLATDATTSTINVGTGAGVKTSTFGSTNSTSATTLQSGSGALNVTATGGALTVNSGTGALGISTDASATTVNVGTGAAAKTVTVGSTNTTSSLALKYGTSDFTLASATGTVMSALDTGEITYPLQPAFFAYAAAQVNNVTGNAAVYVLGTTALTIVFDQNGDMNTNGTFTAPVTGRYNFSGQVLMIGCTVATTANIRLNSSNRTYFTQYARAAGPQNITASECTITDMDAGDTMTVSIQVLGEAGNTVDLSGTSGGGPDCWLSGFLVC